MSNRRNWDRTNRENKVTKKGALHIGQDQWGAVTELQENGSVGHSFEGDKQSLRSALNHLVFLYRNKRCLPYSNFDKFIELNPNIVKSSDIESEYQQIQKVINEDYESLITSMALSKTPYIDFQRAFLSLATNRKQRGKPLRFWMELL